MKYSTFCILVLVGLITLPTPMQAQDTTYIEFAQVFYKKQWHVIDKKGNFLFNPRYQVGSYQNFCFSDSAVMTFENEKFGFNVFNDSVLIPATYELAHCFTLGFAPVQINGKWGFIDKNNRFLVEPVYDFAGSFGIDSLAPVFKDERLGFINTQGKLVIPCQYYWYPSHTVFPHYPVFTDGLLAVYLEQVNPLDTIRPKIGFINTKGEIQLQPIYDANNLHAWFFDGKAVVSIDGKFGLINKQGDFIIPPKFNSYFYFENGFAEVRTVTGETGVINEKGEYVFRPQKVNGIHHFREGFAAVQIRSTDEGVVSAFINEKGEYVFGKQFGFVEDFSEGMASVEVNGKWGFINRQGEMVVPAVYQRVKSFRNGLAVVANAKKKYGYIDKSGKVVIPFDYNDANEFESGLAPVKKGKKFGFINLKNEMVIKPGFENAFPFQKEIVSIK
jgi:hypothetical protein